MSVAARIEQDDNVIDLDEWARRTNAETRRVMGMRVRPAFPSDNPIFAFAERVQLALEEAHARLDGLMTDEEAAACAQADLERLQASRWHEAALDYHKDRGDRTLIVEIEPERIDRLRELLADDVPIERAYAEINKRADAAARTVETLMLGLRERGIAAVHEPKVRARLAQLSEAQLVDVGDRLQRLNPEIARAWSPDDVAALVEAWEQARS